MGWPHEVVDSKESALYDAQELCRWVADLAVLNTLRTGGGKDEWWRTWDFHIMLSAYLRRRLTDEVTRLLQVPLPFERDSRAIDYSWPVEQVLYLNVARLAEFIRDPTTRLRLEVPLSPAVVSAT